MKTIDIKNRPTILKNSDFQTILVQVMFFYKKEHKDLAHISLLPALLNSMNNKYKTESEFVLERKKLMILGTNVNRASIGDNGYFSFHMIVPDTYALGNDMYDEQFAFLKEIIYLIGILLIQFIGFYYIFNNNLSLGKFLTFIFSLFISIKICLDRSCIIEKMAGILFFNDIDNFKNFRLGKMRF